MTILGSLLVVILTSIYWLNKNKELIVWQRKFEAYTKLIVSLRKLQLGDGLLAKFDKGKEAEQFPELEIDATNEFTEEVIILNENIAYGIIVISQKAIIILENYIEALSSKSLTADKRLTVLDDCFNELSKEAQLDLGSSQPSFTRSMRNIWRDIKLFCE